MKLKRASNQCILLSLGFACFAALMSCQARLSAADNDQLKSQPGLPWLEYNSSNFTRPGPFGVDRQLNHDNGTKTFDYARLWIGLLEFPYAGEVTFIAEADDGVRLQLGERLIIDGLKAGGNREGKLTGKAGQVFPVTVEFFQQGGRAHLRLLWSWNGQKATLIPENAFRHSPADMQRLTALSANTTSLATILEQVRKQTPSTLAGPSRIAVEWAAIDVDFARDIQPLFAKQCYRCHSAERREGGLRLDLRRTALQGGDAGDTIVAGSESKSRLIARVSGEGDAEIMPPEGEPLTERQILLLRAWIEKGALWPDALAGQDAAAEHWSFQPIRKPLPPVVHDPGWSRNALDQFVLARLERAGIAPSPEADKFTLLRRLSLDLTGLPPTPDEVQEFTQDGRAEAYAELVERLLAAPHFGERWGRHWLDVARYADSDGYENDNPRPNAWRFRDWVIQSFNRDQPFDQFTVEQLAGDLLPQPATDQLVATGFHRNTLHNGAGGADREEFRTKAVKDRADTTGSVWLGLTLNCCQCHSHKYDPISHREYYGFYAFFNNSEDANLALSGGTASVLGPGRRTSQVHLRGNFLTPGVEVTPHTPSFLPPLRRRGEDPDRLDLARWIVDPQNPLTARVQVNQVWQHLFGAGLVSTPENFGKNGERPAHPELLDWLAAEFMDLNWSRKGLIRTILTSATYRQASTYRPELAERDPANALWGRQNRVQLEAESIRDQALAVSGLLNREIGGPSIQPPLPKGLSLLAELKNERFQEARGNRHRRGLYIHVQRTFQYPMLATFDAPDGNQSCLRRDRSNTPIQALTLLNDPAFVECAHSLARRLMQISEDREQRLRQAFPICLGREASDADLAALRELVRTQEEQTVPEHAVWMGVARTLLNLEELITRE